MSYNAGQKVFSNPDLMEKLLPFLDPTSTLRLVESNKTCILEFLQGSSVAWNNMVRRALPGDHKIDIGRFASPREYWTRVNESFLEKRVQILILIDILKRMDNANSHKLHQVLNVICEKSPPDVQLFEASIQIMCPCHGSKPVSPLGFLLLEEVEAALGSALQEVEMIHCPPYFFLEEPLLSALASRVSRQQKKVARMQSWVVPGRAELVRFGGVKVSSLDSAKALLTLVMQSAVAEIGRCLVVSGNIQAEGWAALAKVEPSRVRVASKDLMKEARKEDLRTVWESLQSWLDVGDLSFYKDDGPYGEESWRALEQILDED